MKKQKKAMHTTISKATYNKIAALAKKAQTTKAAVIERAIARMK